MKKVLNKMPRLAMIVMMSIVCSCGSGSKNANGTDEVNANSSEVVGTLTAYYATEDFKTDQEIEYKKGQLICDSNDPINRIVEQGDDNYKYEGDDTGEYYSWLLPKSKVEKRVYKMNKLEVKDVGNRIKFVSDEGYVARIFWSNINGHGYYNWNGHEHKWEEQQKLKECYVLSVEYRNRWNGNKGYWEEQLDEKQGCINLYSDNDTYYSGDDINYCRYREGPIGYIEERWYNKEGWDDSKSAYSEDGNLLVDQWEIDGIADHTSIAYIAEKNALYVDGELYYKKK